jgi:hypothetical protein
VESVNPDLEDTELVNESPREGMMSGNAASLQEELKNLMQGPPLVDFIKSEIERIKKMK